MSFRRKLLVAISIVVMLVVAGCKISTINYFPPHPATIQAAIDIYVTAPGVDITTVNPNFGSVGYNGTSLNLAFSPATYQIRITTQGTKTVIYDSGGTVLTPNIALSFIVYSKGSGVL